MKNIRIFLSVNFQFLVKKYSIYLNGRVFVISVSHAQMVIPFLAPSFEY